VRDSLEPWIFQDAVVCHKTCWASHVPAAHFDGCSVVILRPESRGFRVLEEGYLSFDGETLSLLGDKSSRPFSDGERDALMPVAAGNRIGECRGFDFFLLVEAVP